MKNAGREALERVDAIDERVRAEDLMAQARAMARASLAGEVEPLLPKPPQVQPREAVTWHLPSPPEFHEDPEVTEDSLVATRFPNSMGFSDLEVETLVRVEHFPGREDVDLEALVRGCRLEGQLLEASLAVGRGWVRLCNGLMQQDEVWEAAVYFSGAHHAPRVEEALEGHRNDKTDESLRGVGFALADHAMELYGASRDAPDSGDYRDALSRLDQAMADRSAMVEAHPELEEELDVLPLAPRGVYGFRGFTWLDS
jgi:hypothetical protein